MYRFTFELSNARPGIVLFIFYCFQFIGPSKCTQNSINKVAQCLISNRSHHIRRIDSSVQKGRFAPFKYYDPIPHSMREKPKLGRCCLLFRHKSNGMLNLYEKVTTDFKDYTLKCDYHRFLKKKTGLPSS